MKSAKIVGLAWRILALSLVLTCSSLVYAGQFEDGQAAFKRRDFQTSIQLWQPLAEKGNVKASVGLGDIYLSGLGGKLDYKQAAKWYRKAAERGDMRAQHNLALICSQGWLGKADYRCAARWYRKAAQQGMSSAQYSLGELYERGLGVKQDWAKAYFWESLGQSNGPMVRDHNPEGTKRKWEQHLTADQRTAIKRQVKNWKPTVSTSGTAKLEGHTPD